VLHLTHVAAQHGEGRDKLEQYLFFLSTSHIHVQEFAKWLLESYIAKLRKEELLWYLTPVAYDDVSLPVSTSDDSVATLAAPSASTALLQGRIDRSRTWTPTMGRKVFPSGDGNILL